MQDIADVIIEIQRRKLVTKNKVKQNKNKNKKTVVRLVCPISLCKTMRKVNDCRNWVSEWGIERWEGKVGQEEGVMKDMCFKMTSCILSGSLGIVKVILEKEGEGKVILKRG